MMQEAPIFLGNLKELDWKSKTRYNIKNNNT
jgi:hypothetical protein